MKSQRLYSKFFDSNRLVTHVRVAHTLTQIKYRMHIVLLPVYLYFLLHGNNTLCYALTFPGFFVVFFSVCVCFSLFSFYTFLSLFFCLKNSAIRVYISIRWCDRVCDFLFHMNRTRKSQEFIKQTPNVVFFSYHYY